MNRKVSKGVFCYACGIKNAKPRDIGGTIYFLCDECFEQHQMANLKAVEYLRNKRIKKNHRNASDTDKAKESRCPAYG